MRNIWCTPQQLIVIANSLYLSFSFSFFFSSCMLRITIGASWQVQEYIYILFFSNIKISKHQTSILVIRDSALSVNQILHSPYIISYAPSMERKPRQKLPFPTSIAIFRHININPKLYVFLSFFFSPCSYWPDRLENI